MMPENLRLVIRADAGPRIGTGHVMRCLALGQAWKKLDGAVSFVCGAIPGALRRRLFREGFECYSIRNCVGDAADARDTLEIVTATGPAWLVLDGYCFGDTYQSRLKNADTRLLVIDDFSHGAHPFARAILNQNVYAGPADYSSTSAQTDVIIGPKFALLRNEFQPGATDVGTKRILQRARRILVTFGGADSHNMTLRTLNVLAAMSIKDLVVDVIVGATYPHVGQLRSFIKSARLNLRVHRNIDRMVPLLSQVDMAVSAGGSTCYELARCGVPSLILPIAENQYAVARGLAERGVVSHVTDCHKMTDEQFATKIRTLMRDPLRRKLMSVRGKSLVDGFGADRIARRLVSHLFQLCPATRRDADLLLRWKNDPATREVSFSQQLVSHEQHWSWLKDKLNSRNVRLWIIRDGTQQPIGQIRLDYNRSHTLADISIGLVQSHRGRGIGTALIEKVCRQAIADNPRLSLRAQIKPSNAASQLAFRKAGFRPIAPSTINGQVANQFLYSPSAIANDPIQKPDEVRQSA